MGVCVCVFRRALEGGAGVRGDGVDWVGLNKALAAGGGVLTEEQVIIYIYVSSICLRAIVVAMRFSLCEW